MSLALYFIIAFVVSTLSTPLCRGIARRRGWTAQPRADRWRPQPIALFGGVAIAVPTLALGATLPLPDVWPLLVCGGIMAVAGAVDDSIAIKPSTKLIVQIAIASVLVFFGYRLGWTHSMIGDLMLTLLWIVGITNAFNLLDNMDGLCAGTVLIAGGFTLVSMAGVDAQAPAALYLAALLGSTAGFLVYNVHPASIFMGDTGSLFVGLNLSAVTLIARSHGAISASVTSATVAPVLLLLVPILDTTLVTAVRLLSGRRASQGGRDHASHRLVAIGLSERAAVAVLWALAMVGGISSVALQYLDSGLVGVATVTFLIGAIIFCVYLARIRIYDAAHFSKLREGVVTPLVVDFMYKRRVVEVILDLCLVSVAYYAAYNLRFEGVLYGQNYPLFIQSLPVLVATQILALFVAGGYRGAWHHFGMMDAVVFGRSVLLGAFAAQIVLLYAYRFASYSRAVFVIHAVLLFVLLCASRASFRLLGEFAQRRGVSGERCVIYGVGNASLGTIREAFGTLPLRIIGFIDDDPQQRRLRVSGYSVLGGFEELVGMVEKQGLDCVVLNTRVLDVDRLKQLESACQRQDVRLLRLSVNVLPFVAAS